MKSVLGAARILKIGLHQTRPFALDARIIGYALSVQEVYVFVVDDADVRFTECWFPCSCRFRQ